MGRLESYLGIEELLSEADARWEAWCRIDPSVAACPSRPLLRGWLVDHPDAGRSLLSTLARLAAPDGGDEVAAAAVLAWVMLPTAGKLARRYRASIPEVEQWLAGQLWMEVRSVPWRRTTNVAAHIRFELGHRLREEVTTCEIAVEPGPDLDLLVDQARRDEDPGEVGSDELLALILDRAVADGVITALDRRILIQLVAYAHAHRPTARRRNGGLTSVAALTHVARVRSVPARTVSRRARSAIAAISAAHCRALEVAV